MIAALCLVAALAAYAWFVRGGEIGWPRRDAPWRASRRFERMAARTLVLFGAVAMICLALAGQWDAPWRFPSEFREAQVLLGQVTGPLPIGPLPLGYVALGIGAGALIGAAASRLTGRRFVLGTIDAVLPRARAELGWGVLLSIVAGVCEELYFRLALPLLVALATGSAAAGFGLSLLLFAAAHRYQGWAGVAATLAAGAVMSWAYLATQSLWTAMVLHMLVDLNGLVLRPLLTGRVTLR